MDYIINITTAILKGSVNTLQLYFVVVLFSVPLGAAIALGKLSKSKWIQRAVGIYTWVFRGTPLLLQLFFVYYGVPILLRNIGAATGMPLSVSIKPFAAAVITFSINYAAYMAEIFRAGIESIDKGQYEAAKVLGMNYWQTMTRIIIPQTIRRVLPPTCNEAITLVKDTALVAAIAMPDLLRAAKEAVTRDFTITPFIIAAAVYLVFTSVVVVVFGKLEKKYSIYE